MKIIATFGHVSIPRQISMVPISQSRFALRATIAGLAIYLISVDKNSNDYSYRNYQGGPRTIKTNKIFHSGPDEPYRPLLDASLPRFADSAGDFAELAEAIAGFVVVLQHHAMSFD